MLGESGEEEMAGGRICAVRRYIGNDDFFLLTYGDGVSDIDVGRLIDFHHRSGKIATVTAVRPPSRLGEIEIEDGRVREFNEKPQTVEGSLNGGLFGFPYHRRRPYLAP